MKQFRVLHYMNQFFAGIGGEHSANEPPFFRDGAIGFGSELERRSEGRLRILRTVVCGDNYAAEHPEDFVATVLPRVREVAPDLLVAGPAFAAGRYGTACASLCSAVTRELAIPAVSGMHEANPGVEMGRKYAYILRTGDSASKMRSVLPQMIGMALRLLDEGGLGAPEEEGYFPRGIRVNTRRDVRGSVRAVRMLLHKLDGEPFTTELPMPVFDHVPPAPPLERLEDALLAIGTEGGIVPRGNPDRIEAHNASKWCSYSLVGLDSLPAGDFEVAHGGYDPVPANEAPDRVLPLDGMRRLERAGAFRALLDRYFVTVGNVTAVASAERYGREIAEMLVNEGVQAVVMTST